MRRTGLYAFVMLDPQPFPLVLCALLRTRHDERDLGTRRHWPEVFFWLMLQRSPGVRPSPFHDKGVDTASYIQRFDSDIADLQAKSGARCTEVVLLDGKGKASESSNREPGYWTHHYGVVFLVYACLPIPVEALPRDVFVAVHNPVGLESLLVAVMHDPTRAAMLDEFSQMGSVLRAAWTEQDEQVVRGVIAAKPVLQKYEKVLEILERGKRRRRQPTRLSWTTRTQKFFLHLYSSLLR